MKGSYFIVGILLRAVAYAVAWLCELSGKLLVTLSESLFKLTRK
jgi:hypothetical protein